MRTAARELGRGAETRDRMRVERLYGVHSVEEALRAGRRPLHRLLVAREGRGRLAGLLAEARAAGVRVEEASYERLQQLVGAEVATQGVLLEVGRLPEPTLRELLATPRAEDVPRLLLALDGVQDPQNLGAVARVAEAGGAAGLILTRRHAPPLSASVSRASAGAIEWLPVARVANLARALDEAKRSGYWVFGSEVDAPDDVFRVSDAVASGHKVLVLGAEGRGVRPGIRRAFDFRVRIPTVGHVGSLNVATAAAVLVFELRRRVAGS